MGFRFCQSHGNFTIVPASHETTVPERYIMTAFFVNFEQLYVEATQEVYWYLWVWIVIWSLHISTIGKVLSLLNFTMIPWISCVAYIIYYNVSESEIFWCFCPLIRIRSKLSGFLLCYTLPSSFMKITPVVFL